MKRLLVVAAGGFGLFAYLRRRRRPTPVHVPPQVEPADELRARLAEKRDEPLSADAPRAADEPEPPAAPEAPPDELGERRQDVHDRARSAMDELG